MSVHGVVTRVFSRGPLAEETITYGYLDSEGRQNITGRRFPKVEAGDHITVEYGWPGEPLVTVVDKEVAS
jgi:hypothetical protein